MWRKIKNGFEYCGILFFYFYFCMESSKLNYYLTLYLPWYYALWPKADYHWAFEMEHKMLSSTHFNFQSNIVHLLDSHTFDMQCSLMCQMTRQTKKNKILFCLVWGLRHRNMHKSYCLLLKEPHQISTIHFGWCWMNFIHIEKCMCWWKMKY